MRILHLTDLHYSREQGAKESARTILAAMKSVLHGQTFDLFAFTGDAVDKGEQDGFNEAINLVFECCTSLGATKDNFIVCLGNHDILRTEELQATRMMINSYTSESDLAALFRANATSDRNHSFANFRKPYQDLINFYEGTKAVTQHELARTSNLRVGESVIGIVAINTAWRAFDSRTDRGTLLFPSHVLKEELDHIKNSHLNVCIMHHALSDLKQFNLMATDDMFYDGFHIILAGHYHKPQQSLVFTSDEGVFISTARSVLHSANHARTGFTSLDVDIDCKTVGIQEYEYVPRENQFIALPLRQAELPMNSTKMALNALRKVIKKRYFEEIEKANDSFLGAEDETCGFLDLFTDPTVRTKSKSKKLPKDSIGDLVTMSQLTLDSTPYLVLGKDKSGRTSLLRKVHLDLLNQYATKSVLPLFIEGRLLTANSKPLNLIKELARYYEVSQATAKELAVTHTVKLVIDDYHLAGIEFHSALVNFLEAYPKVTFIASAEETMSRSYEAYKFGSRIHKNLFIHEASRKDIRYLASKWPGLTEEKRENALGKIEQIFRQLQIPFNYWTVSLFMSVFSRNNEASIQSNVDLIQLYVDGILERERFVKEGRDKITYGDLKVYIANLAHYLATNHERNHYSCSYSDLVGFTSRYHTNNKKFVVEVADIVQSLVDKGILKRLDEQDLYGFRLNGIFEYFLAFYMADNADYRSSLLADEHRYLSYATEFELCMGFRRRDDDFMREIFAITRGIFAGLNDRLGTGKNIDVTLTQKIHDIRSVIGTVMNIGKEKVKVLDDEEKDAILSDLQPLDIQQAEVKRKAYYDSIEENSEHLEKALSILARTYRASDLKSNELSREVFEFIIDSACNLGFMIVEEGEKVDKVTGLRILEKEDVKALVKFITSFVPIMVQNFLGENLLQRNQERIIKEYIQEYRSRKDINQFRLTLLHLSLLDIDLRHLRPVMGDFAEDVRIGSMRFAMLMKSYHILMWRIPKGSSNESFLIEEIEKHHALMDKSYTAGNLEKVRDQSARQDKLRKHFKGKAKRLKR